MCTFEQLGEQLQVRLQLQLQLRTKYKLKTWMRAGAYSQITWLGQVGRANTLRQLTPPTLLAVYMCVRICVHLRVYLYVCVCVFVGEVGCYVGGESPF